VNNTDSTLSQYSIGTGDALTRITSAAPAGNSPYSITVDPSARYVYAANQGDSTVSQYTIGPGGALNAISTPIPTGNYPVCIVAGY
jgi:DNA-binding beta-propeller fold protein YncE